MMSGRKEFAENKSKESFPTKVLIRRLPPTLSSDQFLEEVSPLPEHTYFNYVSADKSLGQYSFCRAVINFKSAEDVILFKERFDDYVFVDAKGHEYPAVVELSPYQKVPSAGGKVDHRENTLDDDAEFKKFLELLENPEAPPSLSIKDVLEEVEAKAKEKLEANNQETPLIAFINKFKLEKKRMQEKLREEKRLKERERKKQREEEKRLRLENKKLRGEKLAGDKTSASANKSAKGASKTSASDSNKNSQNGKAGEKSGKPSSASRSSSKNDDVIVRTIPSGKSKQTSESARPKGDKGKAPSAGGGKAAGDTQRASGRESKESTRPKKSAAVDKGKSLDARPADRAHTKKPAAEDSKSLPDNRTQTDHKSADETAKALGSGPTRQQSGSSEGTESKKSLKDNERSKAAKNNRNRERPEIARYNPAARAAERQQRHTKGSGAAASGGSAESDLSKE